MTRTNGSTASSTTVGFRRKSTPPSPSSNCRREAMYDLSQTLAARKLQSHPLLHQPNARKFILLFSIQIQLTASSIQLPTTPKAKQEANNEPTFYPNISTLTMWVSHLRVFGLRLIPTAVHRNPSTPTSSSQASSGRARSTGIRNHGLRSYVLNIPCYST